MGRSIKTTIDNIDITVSQDNDVAKIVIEEPDHMPIEVYLYKSELEAIVSAMFTVCREMDYDHMDEPMNSRVVANQAVTETKAK